MSLELAFKDDSHYKMVIKTIKELKAEGFQISTIGDTIGFRYSETKWITFFDYCWAAWNFPLVAVEDCACDWLYKKELRECI